MSTVPSGYQAPKTNWQAADIVHPSDFNRIEGNIQAIESGSRTLDPSQVPTGNTGNLRQLLDWFANRIRAITGATNWYDSPVITLAGAKGGLDNLQSALDTHKSSGDHDGRYYRKDEWARSAGGAGYVKLPNGMILQWGLSPSVGHDGNTSATFPIAFPTDCLRVIAVKQNSTTTNDDSWAVVRGFSRTGADFRMEGAEGAQAGTRYVAYLAIGY